VLACMASLGVVLRESCCLMLLLLLLLLLLRVSHRAGAAGQAMELCQSMHQQAACNEHRRQDPSDELAGERPLFMNWPM